MEWAFDFEPYDDLQHLLANRAFKEGSISHAIAQRVIALGIGSLSSRQRCIYDALIAPALEELDLDERCSAPLKAA